MVTIQSPLMEARVLALLELERREVKLLSVLFVRLSIPFSNL